MKSKKEKCNIFESHEPDVDCEVRGNDVHLEFDGEVESIPLVDKSSCTDLEVEDPARWHHKKALVCGDQFARDKSLPSIRTNKYLKDLANILGIKTREISAMFARNSKTGVLDLYRTSAVEEYTDAATLYNSCTTNPYEDESLMTQLLLASIIGCDIHNHNYGIKGGSPYFPDIDHNPCLQEFRALLGIDNFLYGGNDEAVIFLPFRAVTNAIEIFKTEFPKLIAVAARWRQDPEHLHEQLKFVNQLEDVIASHSAKNQTTWYGSAAYEAMAAHIDPAVKKHCSLVESEAAIRCSTPVETSTEEEFKYDDERSKKNDAENYPRVQEVRARTYWDSAVGLGEAFVSGAIFAGVQTVFKNLLVSKAGYSEKDATNISQKSATTIFAGVAAIDSWNTGRINPVLTTIVTQELSKYVTSCATDDAGVKFVVGQLTNTVLGAHLNGTSYAESALRSGTVALGCMAGAVAAEKAYGHASKEAQRRETTSTYSGRA